MSVETGENKNIFEYLNENEIAWMPINLEVTKTKKNTFKKILQVYHGTHDMPNYKDLSNKKLVLERQKLVNEYEYIWIDTRFINQIDVDGDVDTELDTHYFESLS